MISNEWCDWNLTSAGWIRGSHWLDGEGLVFQDVSPTVIQQCRYHEQLTTEHGSLKCWHETLFATNDLDLLARTVGDHGCCPHRLAHE